jgi:hypothetical protein
VRRALQPVVDLAAAINAALIGITQLSKGGQGTDPAQQVIGSISFTAEARVVLVAARVKGEDGTDHADAVSLLKAELKADCWTGMTLATPPIKDAGSTKQQISNAFKSPTSFAKRGHGRWLLLAPVAVGCALLGRGAGTVAMVATTGAATKAEAVHFGFEEETHYGLSNSLRVTEHERNGADPAPCVGVRAVSLCFVLSRWPCCFCGVLVICYKVGGVFDYQ